MDGGYQGPTRPVGRGGPPPPQRRGPAPGPGWGQPQRPRQNVPPPSPPQVGRRTSVLPTTPAGDRPPVRFDPPGGGPPPRAPRPRRKGRWRRRILAVVAVLLLLVIGFGVYLDVNLQRVDALPADSAATSEGTNWLIVGSDSRAGLTDEQQQELATGGDVGQRTDTIMLLHDGSSGPVLVSIPRDSYVPIEGHGTGKINASYSFGGPQLLIKTVEAATGLRIDHYAEIGFGGFVGAVDAVGGVDMCIPQAIKDPKAGLDIKAGCQELDGGTALGYVRTRATVGSDFDRVARQRAFLSALISKATSPTTLLNPFRIVPLGSAVTGTITVDSSDHIWNLASLGLSMRGISGGSGVATTVPVGGTPTIGGESVVRWDKTRAQALFGALAKDQAPPKNALGP